MKEKFFDDFCASFLESAISATMKKCKCTVEECFAGILELAHEGDRPSQTITGLILRADGKPEFTWSRWLSRAVSEYEADESMLVYGLYKYCVSDSGTNKKSCFGDQDFTMAAVYVFKCATEGVFFADVIQSAMIDDFIKHYENNAFGYRSVQVDRSGTNEDVSKRIYFAMVNHLAKISNGISSDDETTSSDFDENNEAPIVSSAYKELANKIPTDSDNKFYSAPSIPVKKVESFLDNSGYSTNIDDVIFYFDNTVFGKGDNGVLVDVENIVLKEQFVDTKTVPLHTVRSIEISGLVNKKILLNTEIGLKESIVLTQSNKGAKILHDALVQLVAIKAQTN